MRLTEFVEALVAQGDDPDIEEPNPVVRILVDGRWHIPQRVFVDYGEESVIVLVLDTGVHPATDEELEHWD